MSEGLVLSVCVLDDSAQASSIDGIKAHSIWLSFLLEQWEVSRQAPSDTLAAHSGPWTMSFVLG